MTAPRRRKPTAVAMREALQDVVLIGGAPYLPDYVARLLMGAAARRGLEVHRAR